MLKKILICSLIFLFPLSSFAAVKKTSKNFFKWRKNIRTTYFWVGEGASKDNNWIPNSMSCWDENWLWNYGGVDNPKKRHEYYPKKFTPKENPFYFALPYFDFDANGKKKSAAKALGFLNSKTAKKTNLFKNRWIKVQNDANACYGQWEDAGPEYYDNWKYVFYGKKPRGYYALDISPALKKCLKMGDVGMTKWRFIAEEKVPDGPWKKIITTSEINWN